MNISFGAKLLTKPEKFFKKTDTDLDKEYITGCFLILERLLQQPEVDKFSKEDTVELTRSKGAKNFIYKIKYNSEDIKDTDIFQKITFSKTETLVSE